MSVSSGTGKYEDGVPDTDMYMVVSVDTEGGGTFAVYDYELDLWGSGTCAANAEALVVIEGALEYSPDPMVPIDWTFYVSHEADNKCVNTTDFTDFEGDTFSSSIFFKPWGADWQAEIDFGRAGIYPPGYDDYMKKVNNGESSPFDGGSAVDGGSSSLDNGSVDGATGSASGADRYGIISMTENGNEMSMEDLAAVGFSAETMYIEFLSDDEYAIALFGEKGEGTYKINGSSLILKDGATDDEITADFDGNMITLELGGMVIVFEKK
jgi:hypothetical protein